MILSFDIDCGELVEGHHFIARGLADCGLIESWDGDIADGFSLEYELAPGIPSSAEAGATFKYVVGIDYRADVDLPWEPTDGGVIAPFRGGTTTHGSRGDWPIPATATQLRFTLTSPSESAGGGELIVDLEARTAAWHHARD